jgi:hypothetical protein
MQINTIMRNNFIFKINIKNKKGGTCMATCNLQSQLLRRQSSGRIIVQGQFGQKFNESPPISTNKLGVVSCTCDPIYMGGIDQRIIVQEGPGKNSRPKKELKVKKGLGHD